MTTSTIPTIAGEVKTGFDTFMKFEPFVMNAASFIPGAAPVTAIVSPVVAAMAPFIDNALAALIAGNNGDAFTAMIQMAQHLVPGQPNSSILAGGTGPITAG